MDRKSKKNTAGRAASLILAATLAGCAGSSLLPNGQVAGPGGTTASIAPAVPPSTPASRAYQVGITSARATKCGYNFDAAKLRSSFLAAEQAAGPAPEAFAKLEQSYDASFATMAKVIAKEENYCTDEKTKLIKADLVRHLAGDYNPGPPHPKKEEEDEGLFSFGSNSQGFDQRTLFEP